MIKARYIVAFTASILAVICSGSLFADDLIVTRHFSGLWDQPEQESQGISLQIVHQDDGSGTAVAYWFTYSDDLETAWYLGVGDVIDNRIEMELFNASGVGFMQSDAPGDAMVEKIGTMLMVFQSCDIGMVTFNTTLAAVGSGHFPVERLTGIHNTHCSGGISDNTDAGVMFHDQSVILTPVHDNVTGRGHANFEGSAGHAEFEVEVEGLSDGPYRLFVGSDDRGEILVSGGKGSIEFRSPAETGKQLLTFDPRGERIDVRNEQGTVLSSGDSTLIDGNDDHHHNGDCDFGGGMGGGMGGHNDDCPEDGEIIEIEAEFSNTGVIPAASGDAEWEMTNQRVEFKVEIEDVPVGSYRLAVGGEEVGVIEAVLKHGEVSGEIEFRDPQQFNKLHLDFDPRGEHIEVLQGNTAILEIDFPSG